MGKSSAPSAPDPYASAAAQYQYGTQAAAYNTALNRPTTTTPFGSQTWNVTGTGPGGAPRYTGTTTLNPAEQQGLTATQGNIARNLSQPLPTPNVQTSLGTGGIADFARQAQEKAQAGYTAQLDPYWKQQQEQLDSSLRNSGAHPGDAAYENAMAQFQAQRTGAYNQATGAAINTGLQAQNLGFQQALGQGEFANTANQQLLAEQLGLRDLPLDELRAFQGGGAGAGGVGGAGGGAGSVNAPDISTLFQNQYQGQLANYNAQVATQNADIGAAAAIAAALVP